MSHNPDDTTVTLTITDTADGVKVSWNGLPTNKIPVENLSDAQVYAMKIINYLVSEIDAEKKKALNDSEDGWIIQRCLGWRKGTTELLYEDWPEYSRPMPRAAAIAALKECEQKYQHEFRAHRVKS